MKKKEGEKRKGKEGNIKCRSEVSHFGIILIRNLPSLAS